MCSSHPGLRLISAAHTLTRRGHTSGAQPESGAEADFLGQWCEARGVTLAVRVVSEVRDAAA